MLQRFSSIKTLAILGGLFLAVFAAITVVNQSMANTRSYSFRATIETIKQDGFVSFHDQSENFRLIGVQEISVDTVNDLIADQVAVCTSVRGSIWSFWYTKVHCRIEGLGDVGLYLFAKSLASPSCPDAYMYGYCGYEGKPFDQP